MIYLEYTSKYRLDSSSASVNLLATERKEIPIIEYIIEH